MLMSCKCLNFIATSNIEPQKYQQEADSATKTAATNLLFNTKTTDCSSYCKNDSLSAVNLEQTVDTMSSTANKKTSAFANADSNDILKLLQALFLEKYPRRFIYYSKCMEFFKQAIGPITNLNINEIAQKDLLFSLTLDLASQSQVWQLSICGNCNIVLCAKLLAAPASGDQSKSNTLAKYFVNNALLTNFDELMQKRCNISFSETFGLLIMDHGNFLNKSHGPNNNNRNLIFDTATSSVPLNVGSASPRMIMAINVADSKQQRLRQLQANMQHRVQREIANTDERIQRYTNQQFALLKGFRDKAEQEYEMLAILIQSLSDQLDGELLDRAPINLEVSGGGSSDSVGGGINNVSGTRRRNTVTTTGTAAAAITTATPIIRDMSAALNSLSSINISQVSCNGKNIKNKKTEKDSDVNVAINNTAINSGDISNDEIITNLHQRKLVSFDTPPATPEAMAINVHEGDSQVRQQKQSFQQHNPTTMDNLETNDDCLFELDDIEITHKMNSIAEEAAEEQSLYNINRQKHHRLQQQSKENLKRQQKQWQSDIYMSDPDESDNNADDAQDDWETQITKPSSGQQMTVEGGGKSVAIAMKNIQHELHYARSLPMEIPKSPPIKLEKKNNFQAPSTTVDGNDIDNKMDIAASIKALAKSVHGETIFGDLPRPRLRSQI